MSRSLLFISLATILFACDSGGSDDSFDMTSMKQEIVDRLISPYHEQLEQDAITLQAAIVALHQDLTLENLQSAQAAWKECALSYSYTEIYNIHEVEESSIHYGIYSWGALESSIEQRISESFTDLNINTLPTGNRGLTAIEYLLFAQSEIETLAAFEDVNRLEYLHLVGANLVEKTTSLRDQWENQKMYFVENTTTGLSGSINQLINSIINMLAIIKKLKIDTPAGLDGEPLNAVNLQADHSLYSLELIEANLNSISELYFLEENNLAAYVASIVDNHETNTDISTALTATQSIINSLNEPLADAIISQPNQISALSDEVQNLVRYFTADVSSALSITVTPTDVDGD